MKQVETREKSPLIDLSGSTSKNQLLDPDGARLDNVTEVGQTKNLETKPQEITQKKADDLGVYATFPKDTVQSILDASKSGAPAEVAEAISTAVAGHIARISNVTNDLNAIDQANAIDTKSESDIKDGQVSSQKPEF